VQLNLEFDTRSVELRIPMAWVYGGMLVGMVLMTFYFFIEVIEACTDVIKHKH
jgi:TRAP-type C4-dicarboxylate transport system permease small subunit